MTDHCLRRLSSQHGATYPPPLVSLLQTCLIHAETCDSICCWTVDCIRLWINWVNYICRRTVSRVHTASADKRFPLIGHQMTMNTWHLCLRHTVPKLTPDRHPTILRNIIKFKINRSINKKYILTNIYIYKDKI